MLRPVEVVQVVPCAACGSPAPEGWEVWGLRMCGGCVGAWNAEMPTSGELAAEVGWDALARGYLERTRAWADARRQQHHHQEARREA